MNDNEKGFSGLGIAPGILEILAKLNMRIPTPIQEQSIPIAIEGKDMMGIAQTGTGKTLAFGIPLIQRVLKDNIYGLVVAPTRELAIQINDSLEAICRPLGIRTATLIGGEPIGRQVRQIARGPSIVLGTPGRIIDHLEQKNISLKEVSIVVLDEADRLLDMGFAPQLKRIMASLPAARQTMLFSATMPEEITQIAKTYLKLPIRIEIARPGSAATKVTQELFVVGQEDKGRLLEKLLQEYKGSVLVFSRTKHGARKIAATVRAFGHPAAEIHSDRSLGQRRDALEGFKTGRHRVLVATDIAARGIDVSNIELVLNYDLPQNAEDYVHRIGRTGRAGGSGHAISFARPNQRADIRDIERLIRTSLAVSKLPVDLPPARAKSVEHEPAFSHHRNTGGGFMRPRGHGGGMRNSGGRPRYRQSR